MRRLLFLAAPCLLALILVALPSQAAQRPAPGAAAALAGPAAPAHGLARAGRAPTGISSRLSPLADLVFAYDDGTPEDQIGWGDNSQDITSAAIWLDHYTLPPGDFPLTITDLYIPWPSQNVGSLLGKQVRLLIYTDADGDNNPANASLLYQQTVTIGALDSWTDYPVRVSVAAPTDLYVGWEDRWAEGSPHPQMYPALVDTTASAQRSWLVANMNGDPPNVTNLAANTVIDLVDHLGFPGNWLIRLGATVPNTPTPAASPTPRASPTACAPGQFSDVHPADYFYTPVQYLVSHGVVSGYADCTFRPYNNTTRAQMVKIVTLGFAIPLTAPAGGAYTFADTPPSQPFFAYIETAAAHNIVSGYACGGPGEPCDAQNRPYFRPNANVTRGQLSKIVVVAAGWTPINPAVASFQDVFPNTAFYTFVETAYCHGIISGYSCGGPGEPCGTSDKPYFRQYNDATRGQIAKIVYGALTSSQTCAVEAASR
jgi:hypothetical protein